MTDADMSLNSVNLGMGGELPRKKSRVSSVMTNVV